MQLYIKRHIIAYNPESFLPDTGFSKAGIGNFVDKIYVIICKYI